MTFFRRADRARSRLAIFPGAFNPPTVAHLAIAESALTIAEEVVFVLPRVFPHKHYSGASLEDRVYLLNTATSGEHRFSVAVSEGGLFADIARECRESYGPDVRLSFLCGRDAAERIAAWDYGRPGAWADMLREFDLMVAARGGEYRPAETPEVSSYRHLTLNSDFDQVSASEVRRRILDGEPWEHLVPGTLHAHVRKIYQ